MTTKSVLVSQFLAKVGRMAFVPEGAGIKSAKIASRNRVAGEVMLNDRWTWPVGVVEMFFDLPGDILDVTLDGDRLVFKIGVDPRREAAREWLKRNGGPVAAEGERDD